MQQDPIGDDIQKQFEDFAKRTHGVLKKFPLIAANEGKNFFQSRFRTQDWLDQTTQPWKKRKPSAKRNTGRAILTDTGRGKRSIRVIQADWGAVNVGIDDPQVKNYMGVHNNGFRGTVKVGEQMRISSRKVATRYGKSGRALKSGMKKIRGASYRVKAHTRKMNMPKRKFIGNSATLNRIIERQFIYQLNTI
ncbi:MAG: hypothetical protein JNK73_13150 [Bacteroidia bacterium]|nr:hypothetical protein [Bacteroidia bacterium]